MLSALYSAAQGLSAMQKKADVTANNVANINTDGFKKYRATVQEDKNGGPQVIVDRVDIGGYTVREETDQGPVDRELSNVDAGEEMVDLMVTERGFEADVKTLQTADEMMKSLVDIKA